MISRILFLCLFLYSFTPFLSCAGEKNPAVSMPANNLDKATFGAGCFWCVEAVFDHLKGVKAVQSGYAGGHVANPSYEQVCNGTTGHAEVVQVHFDPEVVTYATLLEVFWKTHDPTTPNRQGADIGTQYRSIILYHNEQQRTAAEHYKAKLNSAEIWEAPIVTVIEPLTDFYPAEKKHQDFFQKNQGNPYCQMVIQPKLNKLQEVFKDRVKKQ